jgi:GST-like protein
MTPNVLKVMFMLGELDLPYELNHVRIYAGENFVDGFERMHPLRKLPVLVDRDGGGPEPHTVFESGAILIYLGEKTGRLLGDSAAERSHVIQWLMLQMSSVGPAFGNATHFRSAAPPDQVYARRRFITQAARLCAAYDRRLGETRYLAGDTFTVADIATFPWLWKHPWSMDLEPDEFPSLQRWLEDIAGRPGLSLAHAPYRAMVEIDRHDAASAPPELIDRLLGRGNWFLKD